MGNTRRASLVMVVDDDRDDKRNGNQYACTMEVAGVESFPGGPGPQYLETDDDTN